MLDFRFRRTARTERRRDAGNGPRALTPFTDPSSDFSERALRHPPPHPPPPHEPFPSLERGAVGCNCWNRISGSQGSFLFD